MDCNTIRQKLADITLPDFKPLLLNYTQDPLADCAGLKLIGRMPHKPSSAIASSPLSIGFETLDRDTFNPKDTFPWLAQSGIKRARCQTGWMKCEKTPGVYNFDWLDEVVDGLAAIGIETWFSVSFGHPVHTPADAYEKAWKEADGKLVPGWPRGWVGETPYYHGEQAMAAWKNYVTALASHFKGRVHTWEIWNEPEWFWTHNGKVLALEKMPMRDRARDYTDFVRITAAHIRSVIPNANIAADVAQTATAYVNALHEFGLPEHIDTFNYHFYDSIPENGMVARFNHLRHAMTRKDGTILPIWQGESGRAAGKSMLFSFPTQLGQARYLTRRYLTDLICGADVSSFFTITDFLCYYADGADQYYGIIDARKNEPKLAYYALQALGYLCDGIGRADDFCAFFTPSHRFEFGSIQAYNSVWAGSFRRKGVPVFAAWQTEHVDLSAQPIHGCLRTLAQGYETAFQNPIVIDPVRRNVWDASGIHTFSHEYGADLFHTPLTDYPYIFTDLAIFDGELDD